MKGGRIVKVQQSYISQRIISREGGKYAMTVTGLKYLGYVADLTSIPR
jgi:hypothetical protein